MNIFYTEVDENLKRELNARGRTGFFDRSDRAINYMVGKTAGVQMSAYAENDSAKPPVATMGGTEVRTGRFVPSNFSTAPGAVGGYLQDTIVTQDQVDFYKEGDSGIIGNAYVRNTAFTDTSRRTGPYIESVQINIGDHSMGLLNKATVQFVIPNPARDLDLVEKLWFRPGRYISIDIEYPESALVSANTEIGLQSAAAFGANAILRNNTTNGRLTEASVPNREKLKELYPGYADNIEKFVQQMSRMNAVRFEGLITQFDFSYTNDGTISATINVTGTSNVYTDISMYLDSNKAKTEQKPKPAQPNDLKITGSREDFYQVLYNRVEGLRLQSAQGINLKTFEASQWIIPYENAQGKNPAAADRYILVGEPFRNEVIQERSSEGGEEGWGTPQETKYIATPAQTKYARYITFGALIHFVNNYVLTKISGSVKQPEIIFTDEACYSNYYASLVSAEPENILLMPSRQGKDKDCNHYGELVYYSQAKPIQSNDAPWMDFWPGVYEYQGNTGRYFPSRIFINMLLINELVDNMTQKGKTGLLVRSFIESICSRIARATGYAIDLKLVTHPQFADQLMLMDAKYIDGGRVNETQKVIPYSVPMFSNHPNGSVVTDFQFSAKLPESAKNLSYVLNSGDDVSELDIAPYLNFMYNADNIDEINELYARHKTKYDEGVDKLFAARAKFGQAPGVPALQTALQKALAEYVKRPHPDFRTTAQMTAPIFPFEASITLNGIHGFKYGDVLQFDALPMRYRMNTVFSVINITHSVNAQSEWTTQLRCIMRPSLD